MTIHNLLKETIQILANHNKTPTDVEFVTATLSENFWGEYEKTFISSWEEFAVLANENYESGYGGVNVNPTLQIVGKDFWLERHSYDGSEWWEFKQLPAKPLNASLLTGKVLWHFDVFIGD